MGITDSRAILARIESDYKSIRKYCDPVYGQITVIQNKASKKYFALIEKTFLKANTHFSDFLNEINQQPYFLKPQQHYVCDLSLCSDILMHFFLFEFTPKNLEQEISQRMKDNKPFTKVEAVSIFLQEIDIVLSLRGKINPESNKPYKLTISNNIFLCSPLFDLKTLEPVFRNEPEMIEDFDKSHISPQAYKLIINGEQYKAKEVMNRESSVVFILALNFMELLLLADLSAIYGEGQDELDLQKLKEASRQVGQQYGSDFQQVLLKMIQIEDFRRPSLHEIKRLLRGLKKNRRSINRYEKQKDYSILSS